MFRSLSLITAVAGLVAAPLFADTAANKQLVIDALSNTIAKGDASAVDNYFADPYIQHNPRIPSGVAPLKGMLSQMPTNPDATYEPIRIIAEGDLVATHSVFEGFGPVPLVAFDVFRVENGKIVEHWDNLVPLAEEPNPSGRTQIDGETEVTDLDKTEANKALVLDFVQRAFINGENVDFTKYINPAKYLQHNTDAADGLEGLGAFVAYLKENNIAFYYKSVGLTVAEGNFVLVGSEGVFGDQATAFYDLFRLEDGLIVEHWDVIAPMPGDKVAPGYPGKF